MRISQNALSTILSIMVRMMKTMNREYIAKSTMPMMGFAWRSACASKSPRAMRSRDREEEPKSLKSRDEVPNAMWKLMEK